MKNTITSPMPTDYKPEVQDQDGALNYLAKLQELSYSDLCNELCAVRAAKFNLTQFGVSPLEMQERQMAVTDLTDKTMLICLVEFGQEAIRNYCGQDLRGLKQLINDLDDEVASLDLQSEQHGAELLKRIATHIGNEAKDFNLMSLQGYTGISDQDYVDDQGLPQELAQTPEMNLWLTYYFYLENEKRETPEETKRLLDEQFQRMRQVISSSIWSQTNPAFETNDDTWWMDDDNLMKACRLTYEKFL